MHIDKQLFDFIEDKFYGLREVRGIYQPYSRYRSRCIQVSTPIEGDDYIHYEYNDGKVQLHLEGKYVEEKYKLFVDFLHETAQDNCCVKWAEDDYYTCVLDAEIETYDSLYQAFNDIIEIFDAPIQEYTSQRPDLFSLNNVLRIQHDLSYSFCVTSNNDDSSGCNKEPEIKVSRISELSFDKFVIPSYQRPYKWTAKNVNQLITDIITFRDKDHYRLGTLVLYNNEIVDGQQRIVTLTLLLKVMLDEVIDEQLRDGEYKDINDRITAFVEKTQFHNRYSLHNIVENIGVIKNRKKDFDEKLLEFVLRNCEFVVVRLNSISEAFQFFDSQNARGKDLAAHDLLKAFHLREIVGFGNADNENIRKWQDHPTEDLKDLFLTLFRAKLWSHGKSAREFTKDNIRVFKGASVKNGKRYPFYQMEIIIHQCFEFFKSSAGYPYNLDDQIVNGSRFFGMVNHYMQLFQRISSYKEKLDDGSAKDIMNLIHNYVGAGRVGDEYVRSMFYTLLLYYVDRFGEEELEKIIPQLFIWAYRIRIELYAVQLSTIDNYASGPESMFRSIFDAQSPYDIINMNIEGASKNESTGCEKLLDMFKSYNKYYGNE